MAPFRLRTHLIAYCTLITLLLTVAVIVFYSRLFKEYALDSLAGHGRAITLNTALSVTDHLITENYAPLQEYVRELSARSDMDAIQISDEQWNVLAASDLALLGTTMEEEPAGLCVFRDENLCIRIDHAAEQLMVTAPIVVGGTVLGRTRVFLSTGDIMAYLRTIQRDGALIGLTLWLFAVFLGYLLARRMAEPVQEFMEATDSISRGDFRVQAPGSRWVLELDRFSRALGVMGGAIAARERELQSSEEKYRHLYERAMEGIFVADGTGRLLDVNPAFIAILRGASREVLLGQNLFANIFESEESLAAFREQMHGKGFVRDYELDLIRSDSSPVTVSLICHGVRDEDGRIVQYEGMVRDISAQKSAEREIVRMRNYLRNIIESMPSMLVTLDENSVVSQWNGAASKLTGIPADQAIGRRVYEIAPLFSRYAAQIAEATRTRQPVVLPREQVEQAGGRVCTLTFFPLLANGGNGVALRLDDVTELEKKEQQLRQAQKMETVGTLAGGLAHDFNNVLAGILGNLSLLHYRLDSPQGLSVPETREYLERMETAGQRAVDMVRQLLTLSRKQQAELVPVDLNLSVKHVGKIGENTFDKSVRMVLCPAQEPAYVLADTTEVEQVLLNLCINAVHSMTIMRQGAPWGGTLTIAVEKVEADAEFRRSHPQAGSDLYWRVSVRDTGVGMDSRTMAKIFDPFFTTKEQGQGTGLGLAMAYNIVRQQEGFIDVHSEPGHGSAFSVCLPLLARADTGASVAVPPDVLRGQGLVLVVDDDDIVRRMAEEVLRSVGYTVLTAGNGREGVELYRLHHEKISAVLLDMAMPVLSGREAFAEMKKINEKVKVLLVSGFRKDGRVEEVLRLGVKDFLQKPYTITSLALAIRKVIDS